MSIQSILKSTVATLAIVASGSLFAQGTPINAAAFDALVAQGPVADAATIASSTWASKIKQAGTLRVIVSVVLPQALRTVVQPMTSLLIALMLSTSLASQVPFPGRELTALVSKIATDSAAGMAAFAVAATMYVVSGLLIGWAGAVLEKKVRILK